MDLGFETYSKDAVAKGITASQQAHGGNLALSRFYSRIVALQIKARLEAVPTPVYGRPLPREAV